MSSGELVASSSQSAIVTSSSKRRLSTPVDDASDSGEPAAKRAREDDVPGVVAADEVHVHSKSISPMDTSVNGRDKKKRRKKKKKLPIIQQHVGDLDGQPPKPLATKTPAPASAASVSSSSVQVALSIARAARLPISSSSAKPPSSARTYQEHSMDAGPSPSSSKVDKGKQRATSFPPTELSANGPLPSQDAADLLTHRTLISAVVPSLTCQICLLLMNRPFALAPCGHVACHSCLVNWFTNNPALAGQNQAVPEIPAPAPAPAANANNNADGPPAAPVPRNEHRDVGIPAPQPRGGLAALLPRPLSAMRRKKTCPHCRAIVRERPVEVWAIKEMVVTIVKSGLADPDSVPLELRPGATAASSSSSASTSKLGSGVSTPGEDPWKDVFPPVRPTYDGGFGFGAGGFADAMPRDGVDARENFGLRDDEDGGVYRCLDCMHEIWDGICTGCARVYPGHGGHANGDFDMNARIAELMEAGLFPQYDSEDDDFEVEDEDERELELEIFRRLRMPRVRRRARLAGEHEFGDEDEHDEDDEDDEGEDVDGGDDESEDDGLDLRIIRDLDAIFAPRYPRAVNALEHDEEDEGEDEDEDEDGGYESSFIDDSGPVAPVPPIVPRVAHESDDDEIVEVPPPARASRGRPRRQAAPIVISDDDEEEVAVVPPSRTRRRGRGTIEITSDEEEGSSDLAAAVAARERDMYGDDGSLPSRLTRRAHRDEDMSEEDGSDRDSEHSGAEDEGDDEDADLYTY